jgi:DNA-damage-inducible protein D
LDNTDIEFWYARDLQKILSYQNWDKFQNVIQKAQVACDNSKIDVWDHFRHTGKMVEIELGVSRETNFLHLKNI